MRWQIGDNMDNIIDITKRLNNNKEIPNFEIANKVIDEMAKTENHKDFTVHLDNLGNISDTLVTLLFLTFPLHISTI